MIYDDIATALMGAGIGQQDAETADWFIRVQYMQAAPDRSICIYAAGGRPPETFATADYPTIQIKVRGGPDDAQAALTQEAAIYKFLHATNAPVLIGEQYVYCYALQSGPIPMGQDENRRPSFVRNYRLMVDRSLTPAA